MAKNKNNNKQTFWIVLALVIAVLLFGGFLTKEEITVEAGSGDDSVWKDGKCVGNCKNDGKDDDGKVCTQQLTCWIKDGRVCEHNNGCTPAGYEDNDGISWSKYCSGQDRPKCSSEDDEGSQGEGGNGGQPSWGPNWSQ